jgi:hypothetical protein
MIPAVKRKKKKYDKRGIGFDPSKAESYLDVLSDSRTKQMLQSNVFQKAKDFGMSRKQYYTRLSWLTDLGLMKKMHKDLGGHFELVYARTTFGETINNIVAIVDELARNSWRFKSYDSVSVAVDKDGKTNLTTDERQSLKETLFSDPRLKRIMALVNEASHLNHVQNETNLNSKGGERKN